MRMIPSGSALKDANQKKCEDQAEVNQIKFKNKVVQNLYQTNSIKNFESFLINIPKEKVHVQDTTRKIQ